MKKTKAIERAKKRPGRPPKPKPSRAALARLYVQGRLSLRDVAFALGISKDAAARALAAYDIELRPNYRRGRLADIPLELLEANVAAKGLRGFAREIGLSTSGILREIRKKRAI